MSDRPIRLPAEAAEFNKLSLSVTVTDLKPSWYNLRWKARANPKDYFFASTSGRLTPSEGKVNCLYLAENAATAFKEMYGDAAHMAREALTFHKFTETDLKERVFLKTTETIRALRLYDLTQPNAIQHIDLDMGTLYHPDVTNARKFAQRIHDHPAKFDGVQYDSRHTNCPCIVLWTTYTPALSNIGLGIADILEDLAVPVPSLPDNIELFGERFIYAKP